MNFQISIGISKGQSAFKVGREATRSAISRIKAPMPRLGFLLVFSSSRYNSDEILKGIRSINSQIPLIGCSTAGEISHFGPDSDTCTIMCIYTDTMNIGFGLGTGCLKNSRQAGQAAARKANQILMNDLRRFKTHGSERSCFISFSDGLNSNGSDIIRGVQEVLGTSFPMVGAAAADDFYFDHTKQFFNNAVYEDAIAGMLIGGNISIGIGARHGWKPLGRPMTVTQSLKNLVMEIDGENAVNKYKHYFEENTNLIGSQPLTKLSILYPIGMSIQGEEEYIIRYPVNINPNGSITFAGDIPQGTKVRLMMGSRETADEAAKRAATEALSNLKGAIPEFLLVFESASRKKVLGREAYKEINHIKEVFGNIPFAGMYSYGEIAPLKSEIHNGLSYFHNESIVILAFGSKK